MPGAHCHTLGLTGTVRLPATVVYFVVGRGTYSQIHVASFIYPSYDFGYLLKILSGELLPDKEIDFFRKLKDYLCNFYDCKEIKREVEYLNGGLSKVAKDLDVDRVGA